MVPHAESDTWACQAAESDIECPLTNQSLQDMPCNWCYEKMTTATNVSIVSVNNDTTCTVGV